MTADLQRRFETIHAADGFGVTVYRVSPPGRPRGGLVVLQEIFGVTAHIRDVADGYAADGWEVAAPALFDRVRRDVDLPYDGSGVATGRDLRSQVGWDAALADVRACVDHLKRFGPVAVLGYCWGGTLAFLAATRIDGVAASVAYYGGQTVPFADEKIRVPVLMHFGAEDPRIPEADRETIRQGNPAIEMHVFPADHGFNCDHRKEFHEESAREALRLTRAFLDRNVAPA